MVEPISAPFKIECGEQIGSINTSKAALCANRMGDGRLIVRVGGKLGDLLRPEVTNKIAELTAGHEVGDVWCDPYITSVAAFDEAWDPLYKRIMQAA